MVRKTLAGELVALSQFVGNDTFQIEGSELVVPELSGKLARFARSVIHGELSALLHEFRKTPLTSATVGAILETYVIAKRAQAYKEMLKVRHTSMKGGSMMDIHEKDPGALPTQLVCGGCQILWLGDKCLQCQSTENQGNIFSLLNQKTKKMPTSAFLMQLIIRLHQAQAQIAPSHIISGQTS